MLNGSPPGAKSVPGPQARRDRACEVRARATGEELNRFGNINRFCLFVGQSRSGHSVLGTLLNAHRQAVISHNLDALAYLDAGVGREDLFLLILERDRWLGARQRRIGGHSYDIPGLWLGAHDEIRVIGDKRAGATSRHLGRDPGLLAALPDMVGCEVSVIHHLRDPLDNISSIWSRRTLGVERSLAEAADHYFEMLDGAVRGIAAAGPDVRWIRTYHEDLIRDPRSVLVPALELLHLPADEYFLEKCENFVHREPRRTHRDAPWSAALRRYVAARLAAYPFMDRYPIDP